MNTAQIIEAVARRRRQPAPQRAPDAPRSPRQEAILAALALGPHSVEALMIKLGASSEAARRGAHETLRTLAQRGLVRLPPHAWRQDQSGKVVELVEAG